MTGMYATIEEVRAQRGLSALNTADDDKILQLIDVASRKIDHHCNVMPGAFAGETQTRHYTAHNSEYIHVDNLLEITNLITDNGYNRNYSSTWATTQYDLMPYNATMDGVPYHMIQRIVTATLIFPAMQPRGVRIIGLFGYSREAPSEVKEACLLLISRFMTRKGSDFGTIGGGEVGIFRISPMDPDVQGLLEPYRERMAH